MPAAPQDVLNSAIRPLPEPEDCLCRVAAGSVALTTAKPVYAVEEIRRMRGGSQAHLMRCSDGNYYVVKFQNNPQHRRVLVNEMLGTKLAALLGLPTVAVAVIEVTGGLIQLTPDLHVEIPWSPTRERVSVLPGLQFGSRYPGDPHQLTLFDFLPNKQLSSMLNLRDFLGMLVFDLWTCNVDPRQVIFGRLEVGKPYRGWMIDQGLCFNGEKWNFPDKPRRNLYDHKVVYEQVQGIESFEPWLARLESEKIARALWSIARTVPPEWYEFDSKSLQDLLTQLDSRRSIVRKLLWSARSSSPVDFPNWIDGPNQLSDPFAKSHLRGTHRAILQVLLQEADSIKGENR